MLGLVRTQLAPWTVVHVRGEIDMATAPQLRNELVALTGVTPVNIVVDLADVDFIDSTGLGVLIGGLKRARSQDGELLIAGCAGQVAEVFALTGLDLVFPRVELSELAGRS